MGVGSHPRDKVALQFLRHLCQLLPTHRSTTSVELAVSGVVELWRWVSNECGSSFAPARTFE
eukprot:1297178-Rhodomonas_salina.1